MTCVALIPARAGSKRLPGKNTRLLAGHPLLAYTIAAARASGIFEDYGVWVLSDDLAILDVARTYGALTFQRPDSPDDEPDIAWVGPFLATYEQNPPDCFAILRPTTPFRSADSLRAAWAGFQVTPWADSLRAVRRWEGPHPGKMWRPKGKRIDGMVPAMVGERVDPTGRFPTTPFHSSPTQTLPPVYVQTAGLEIARTAMCLRTGTIAGDRVTPWIVDGPEALDLNTTEDWYAAEALITSGKAILPPIDSRQTETVS